ncbi:MAG: molybdopterin-guanine dinucleotide biosynthesis protein B [Anaerolineae bacterium]|nr:molybdopterin-guanine dinucleotide biosynthesis protein B [Anaerolineae bacterium]
MAKPPVISVVGFSNVGKTTLMVKLIRELTRRGYRVATIKHDVHGFQMDTPGKDSWKHAEAGSDCVVVSSPDRLAMIRRVDRELTLDEIVATLPEVDIVLTEGYKRGDKPKIEVSRAARGTGLLCTEDELIALATDHKHDVRVPQFDLDDVEGIVNLLERLYLRQ